MYPNTNFLKFFPAEELSETKGEAYRSGCLRVGTYLVLRRIISEYYLDEMLGDIDFVEYGHPKEDISAPVINYSVAYDRNNAKPLYYEDYPGSIVDISQLQYTLEKADGYGYKNIGFILDRGYFSKENIHYMDKCGYGYTERDPESI